MMTPQIETVFSTIKDQLIHGVAEGDSSVLSNVFLLETLVSQA